MSMSIDEKLGLDKFCVDEENAHIIVDKKYPDQAEKMKLLRICPAALYKLDDNGDLKFDYIGCLECGACRIAGLEKVVTEWNYPIGSMEVEYRKG